MRERHRRARHLLALLLTVPLAACSPSLPGEPTSPEPLFSPISPVGEAPEPTEEKISVQPPDATPSTQAQVKQEPLPPPTGVEQIPAPQLNAEGPQPIRMEIREEGSNIGPPENLLWEATNLEAYGFTQLRIEMSAEGQNARLQFPTTPATADPGILSNLSWTAYGLNGEEEALGRCESDWYFTDSIGQRIGFPDAGSTFIEGPYSRCKAATNMIIPAEGPLTLNFFIRNPGFERLHLTFDILGVS